MFALLKSTPLGRRGRLTTAHGAIETPFFMPVGTAGAMKGITFDHLLSLGTQVLLCNTYHLHLQPGEEIVAGAGGLHPFVGWEKPILTDSGGYQVYSLRTISAITEDGVQFRSHVNGDLHFIGPKESIEIQWKLGADIIMAFDECTPDSAGEAYTKEAMGRTHRWAARSGRKHRELQEASALGYPQFLFGIIQGANHEYLRKISAEFISGLEFDGIAIGGESVGYNMAATKNILHWVMPLIPEDKPHYTMGVGYSPSDLFAVVEQGIDMFDCVAPTRVARNGTLFVHRAISPTFKININNAQYRADGGPVDPSCPCFTCQNHTRGYLHHLFKAEELLAYRLATIHNLHFFLTLMSEIRQAIQADRFSQLKQEWV